MNRYSIALVLGVCASMGQAQSVQITSYSTEDAPAPLVDVNDVQAVNSLIEKYHNREVEPGSMADQLRQLRHRILADPFPIPQEITSGSHFEIAIQMANRYGIPAQLFFNLVTAESNWDAMITSHRGAIGLTQLMPGTAAELGVDPWDAYENLEGGARYLSQQYQAFGSWDLALAAYNAGPGAVRKYGGIPPYAETQEYVTKILQEFDEDALESALDISALPERAF